MEGVLILKIDLTGKALAALLDLDLVEIEPDAPHDELHDYWRGYRKALEDMAEALENARSEANFSREDKDWILTVAALQSSVEAQAPRRAKKGAAGRR